MFAAINYISCQADYQARFEQLFTTRARAIDRMPGFKYMRVLKPMKSGEAYLVISFWEREEDFMAWTKSPEFAEGHRRGFADLRAAQAEGKAAPMKSEFRTYTVLTD